MYLRVGAGVLTDNNSFGLASRYSRNPLTLQLSLLFFIVQMSKCSLSSKCARIRNRILMLLLYSIIKLDSFLYFFQVIKMLILVIVLFLICWGSRISMEISIKVGLESFSQGIYFLRVVVNMLPYVHSCLNPFIYSLMSKNFRRSMWRRIHSCCCCICANTYCCVRRRCICRASNAFSSTARAGHDATPSGDRSPGGQRTHCRHCRQFSSQYNLNDLSVGMGAGVSLNTQQERQEVNRMANGSTTTSRLRGITTRLARGGVRGGSGASSGSSPLLLMRTLSINNRSVCSTSVIPECTEHSEVDCCL